MKKPILLAVISFCFISGFSQNRHVIQLTDKNNSPYSVSNPAAYLSPKAIARRAAHGIGIDQLDIPVNPAYVSGIANTGATVLSTSKWLNTVTIFTMNPSVLAAVQALPYVSSTAVVGRPSLPGTRDGKFGKLIPYKKQNQTVASRAAGFDYGLAANQIQMIGGDHLHDSGFRGENMTIAVLDAGFLNVDTLVCFDSLRSDNRLISTYDFVNFDVDVYQDDAHGAEVLSLMAGLLPGQIIGTAPKASYMLLRSEDASSEYLIEEYNWAAAAEYADSAGADLINTSLGYTEFWDSTQNHTYADMDGNTTPVSRAADIAASRGILVESSAGNEGSSNWNYISAPADADSVLATGAVDDLGNYASFSSNGPSFDGRVKPNVACQGQGAYVYLPWGGGVAAGSGTSFSGPIMTGMAACLWQAFPNMNNMQILHAIERSASQYANPDTLLGYGIPDFVYAKTLLTIEEMGGNVSGDQLMNLYPCPFHDQFMINFFSNSSQTVKIELFDISGRRIFQQSYAFDAKTIQKVAIRPGPVSRGAYVLKIRTNEGDISRKILKF